MTSLTDKERILIVDDDPNMLELLRRNLSTLEDEVLTASGVTEAIGILDKTPIDLVITDMKMPARSGLDLIRHVRENCRNAEVMVVTGYATEALRATRAGAEEYLVKPFTEDELFSVVQKALNKLHTHRVAPSPTNPKPATFSGIISEAEAMRQVFHAIEKAASTSATVLVAGESGTGKELVARAIHYRSARAAAPFVPVNCGGIPEQLLESELFGYVKGAFTGATETRAGFFQTAEGGTIFLDEISETSLAMQVKLLRVLHDKEVRMVGSTRARHVDVRIIAATNKDLLGLVKKGAFRDDLFYRLNVIAIDLPACASAMMIFCS
jgi:DNA-binding NtrC family response regulator